MNFPPVKLLSATAALFLGSGLASVYALTETDFTNTGFVLSAPAQFENNGSNNTGTVLVQPKGLTVEKVADGQQLSTPTKAGEEIVYTITLDNVGLLPLTGIALADSIIAPADLSLVFGDTNGDSNLDGDETWVFTGTYTITQADIDTFGGGDGDIDNEVIVSSNELDPVSDSTEVPISQAPAFAVRKSVDKASINTPSTLNYTIEVENTGNQTLTGVALVDTLPDATTGVLIGPDADTGIANAIDVGEIWSYTGTYTVSQADIDAGDPLENVVSVTTAETQAIAQQAIAVTAIESAPRMQVNKTVDTIEITAPTVLNYVITVENTGNVSLNAVAVEDTLPDGSAAVLSGPGADIGIVGALDVGESWTFTTTYAATQADVDANLDLVNIVRVSSDETADDEVTAEAITRIVSEPALAVTKNVDASTLSAPDTLNYTIEIANTGNTSLSNVQPVDTLPDGSTATLTGPVSDAGLTGILDVGEVWEFTTTYTVSQAEIDQGLALVNQVDVVADQTGDVAATDRAQTTLTRTPAFALSKTVDASSVSEPSTLNYEISLSNTGNTSLSQIALTDTMPDGSAAMVVGPLVDTGLSDVLDVGETWVFTAEYVVTQADLDAGSPLINTVEVATAEASAQSDTATTTVSQAPGIAILKSSGDTDFTASGDSLSYTLEIVNTGNVVLTGVVLDDPNADAGSLTCPLVQPFALQPGERIDCSAIRTVLATDITTTSISNQATVSASGPAGELITESSNTVVIPLLQLPPVATDNSVESPVSGVPVTLAAAADDEDPNGDLDVTTLSLVSADASDEDGDTDNDRLVVPGEGVWLVDDLTGEVTFTPEPGYTADPTPIRYVVSDATALVSNQATLRVDYPQSAPVAEDDFAVNPLPASPVNPTSVPVLADNGNGADSDPENDIRTTSVNLVHPDAIDTDGDGDNDQLSVPEEGTWTVEDATGIVTFTPDTGFLFDPTPVRYTISDVNGLTSNEASIAIEYPQTAPVANDDEKLDQPLAQPVTLAVLDNDTDAEGNIDTTSVYLVDSETQIPVRVLNVPDEGVWSVHELTGAVTFTPVEGFIEDPAPVTYSVKDTTDLESNLATITVTYEEPAALEGIVWLDSDRDGLVGPDEALKANWTLRVFDAQGNPVATTTTDTDGFYRVDGLVPGEYRVDYFNEADVFMDSHSTDGPIASGTVVNLPLPVDPGGVVYDSVSRVAVAGVTLNLLNSDGVAVDAVCLRQNQQSQVTQDDGLYAFNLTFDVHESCQSGDTFRLDIAEAPTSYRPNFSSIIRQVGAQSCGDATLGCAVSESFDSASTETRCTLDTIPDSNACEVQVQPDAPQASDDTRYFVEFLLQSGDQNVVFNHIPIDARDNDARILLTKSVAQRSVSRGSIVEYTIDAENSIDVPALDIVLEDTPPANFALVEESVRLIRAGADGELGTADDSITSLTVTESDPVLIGAIDFAPLETVRFRYLMRVGVGVVAGEYINSAVASGPNGIASNTASATVQLVPDPVLEQATLVGKVFNDRDEDGTQDPADATGVVLRSDFYGWNSLLLPELPGRKGVTKNPSDEAIVVNMPSSSNNAFTVSTREGTNISVDHAGNISEAHVGAKARGLTGQDIRVCTQYTVGIPTNRQGVTPLEGEPMDVLQIIIQNYGVSELGIPGVRLATVTGLLIETDAYGRYSVPDVDAGTTGIGQNFVLKVDPATLPQGSTFTTENPYLLRIINSSLNKINFGVRVPEYDQYAGRASELCAPTEGEPEFRTVEVSLGSVFFNTNQHGVREDQQGIVNDIANKLREYGGGTVLIETHADSRGDVQSNIELAERRAATIRRVLEEKLGSEMMRLVDVDVNPAAYQEQGQ